MISGKITLAALALALMAPAATAAPLTNTHYSSTAPLVLVRDGGGESRAYRQNWGRTTDDWRFGDERYGRGYGPYYGPRDRVFGYEGYYGGPSVGLGLSPYRHHHYGYGGPSFGIYVNP